MRQPKPFYEKIGRRIRERREALGMTMDQLNKAAGLELSRSSISYIELGQQEISGWQIRSICSVLGVKIDELLSDEEMPHDDSIKIVENGDVFSIIKNIDSTSEQKMILSRTDLLDFYIKIQEILKRPV